MSILFNLAVHEIQTFQEKFAIAEHMQTKGFVKCLKDVVRDYFRTSSKYAYS